MAEERCCADRPEGEHTAGNRLPLAARMWTWPLLGLVYAYRYTLGPIMGGQCRFYPTCSQYALDALRVHGALRGSLLTIRRLSRCHPFGGGGIDPVVPCEPKTAGKPEGSIRKK